MSDVIDRIDTQLDDLNINLSDDDAISDDENENEEIQEEIDDVDEMPHNSVEEMKSKIIIDDYRDMFGKIYAADKQKRTLPFITKYERARIIGIRAQQISTGSAPLINVHKMTNTIDIATQELIQKKIPFIIKRVLPDNSIEYWTIDELMIR
jgi:DNA-directed RNA polymerase I, II, and III subunit RPABC2